MELFRTLLALCFLCYRNFVYCEDGPVFNNAAQQVAPTPLVKPENYVTQTVYGFLDFTTTIANTVMIFSPNSAAPAALPVTEKAKDITSNSIIDTKPAVAVVEKKEKEVKISPSKPQSVNEKTVSESENKSKEFKVKAENKVDVKPDSMPKKATSDGKKTAKVQVKSEESVKINVIESQFVSKPEPSPPVIISKVEVVEETPQLPQIVTKVEVVTEELKTAEPILTKVEQKIEPSVAISSVVQIKSDDEPAVIVGNNIGEPEYDFLSRQPSEFVEETYKLINLRPSSRLNLRPRASIEPKPIKRQDAVAHPTGLVSKIEGMMAKDGVMTSYETRVIGTYINGKYAQVLQSTSQVFSQPQPKGNNIRPTPSVRILKTAAPVVNRIQNQHRELDPTPIQYEGNTMVENFNVQPQGPAKANKKSGKRFKSRSKEHLGETSNEIREVTPNQPTSGFKKSNKNRSSSRNSKTTSSSKRTQKSGRGNRKQQNTTPSHYSEEIATPAAPPSGRRSYNSRKKVSGLSNSNKIVNNPEQSQNSAGFSRRAYKPKVQSSAVDSAPASTSLYKFKLNRSPGRWQYKTTPKPRVTIRKQNDDSPPPNDALEPTSPASPTYNGNGNNSPEAQINNEVVTSQSRSDDVDSLEGSESIASIIDDNSETNNKLDAPVLPLETLKVEISTPPDFSDVYYEIATIKSPYTFKVGNVQNTRFITVTSTFEKTIPETPEPTPTASLTEPLTENILATSTNFGKDNNFLDSSIATLPPIYLASDQETPPLETLTETFSTTQSMLKTHLLPIVKGVNETMTSTLVQTYLITRLVTATKTLPPMEAYQFIPSKNLKDFNSHLDEAGSELHLELEFGDQNDEDGGDRSPSRILPDDLDLSKIGQDFNLPDNDKSKIEQEALKIKKQKAKEATTPAPINPNVNPQLQQQLALLGLLNPAAQQGQVITTSKPVLKVETLYETHVLPVTQGQNTVLSTISKVKGTTIKTDYEFGTSTIAPALPQVPQYPNPLYPQPQIPQLAQLPQFTITSSPVIQSTMVTQTNSKVLKLTFGARTAQTTVFSTTVVPSIVTSYITASVPVQATAFPGFFPPPYSPFGYVGNLMLTVGLTSVAYIAEFQRGFVILVMIGAAVLALCLWLKFEPGIQQWLKVLDATQFYIGVYIFFIACIVIMVVAFLGCLSALQENSGIILAYVGTQVFGFIALLAGSAVLLDNSARDSQFQPRVREAMRRLIMNAHHAESKQTLAMIQEGAACCGADGANDYLSLQQPLPTECRDTVTGNPFYHGCVDELTWFFEAKCAWIAGLAMTVCFIHVINVVLSITLIQALKKEEEQADSYRK